MTRKDYELIAGTIREIKETIELQERRKAITKRIALNKMRVIEMTEVYFAINLKKDNARFDEGKFASACYLKSDYGNRIEE